MEKPTESTEIMCAFNPTLKNEVEKQAENTEIQYSNVNNKRKKTSQEH